MLLVAAGLFIRTFSSLALRERGFDEPSDPGRERRTCRARGLNRPRRPELFRRLLEAAAAVPGVSSAALSELTPLGNNTWNNLIELADGPPLPEAERLTYFNMVSVGWFQTYGTPLLAGRDFTSADTPDAHPRGDRQRGIRETIHRRQEPDRDARPSARRDTSDRRLRQGCRLRIVARAGAADAVPPLRTGERAWAQPTSISVRAAGGSPTLLHQAARGSAQPGPRRSQDHVQAAGGSSRCGADTGTRRCDALRRSSACSRCCSRGSASTASRRMP